MTVPIPPDKRTIKVSKDKINGEALRDELAKAISGMGCKLFDLSFGNGVVLVEVTGVVNPEVVSVVTNTVKKHNPSQLTQRQKEIIDIQKRIDALKEKYSDVIDPRNFTLEELAERVLLLELRQKLLEYDFD